MATVSGLITAPDGIRLHYVKIGTASKDLVAPGVGNEADFEALTRRRTVIFGRVEELVNAGAWLPPLREQPPPPTTDAERIAMERVAELRERGLDRTDPVAFARAWRRITAPVRMGDPAAFDKLRSDPAEWPNEWPDHMMAAMARVMNTHPRGFDYTTEARSITAPTLVVAGGLDRFPSLDAIGDWTTAIPAARLVVLPQVGHYPQAEARDSLFEAIDTFLAPN